MGRLFWKFFLSILLAQLAATIGVGTVFWLRDQSRAQSNAHPVIDTSRAAEFLIDSAAVTLKHGGKEALRELINESTRYSLYVIEDDTGHDMLGRLVTPELRAEAAALLADGSRHNVVRMLTAPDGTRYLVFLRWLGERHRGPGALPQDELRHVLRSGTHGPGGGVLGGPGMGLAGGPDGHGGPGGPGGLGDHGGPGGPGGPGGQPPEHHFFPYITMIGAILASLLFAALLAWYFSRPIRALRSAFEAAAAGDLAPRFGAAGKVRGDELADLGRDFDRMSGRLRTLMEGQRRLLHDVSHELRSPLARLHAAIGLAHQQPERLAASLDRIERESVRMDKLLGELLTLSRLDAAPALPVKEDIAIMELVEEIASDARFEAEQSQRRIEVSGLAIVNVRGAPDLLWPAIENVVRNAIKHSPPGGAVGIDVSASAAQVSVAVLDQGPGVAPADLNAIFEPFFRSNATSNDVDGHGLGLAIAQRVISAHGGTIVAQNRDGGGLCVTITLPVA